MEEAEMALLLSSKDGTASPAVIKPSKDSFAESHKAIPASSYDEEYWKRCIANLIPPKVAEKSVKTKDHSDPFDDNIKRYKINYHLEAELLSAQKISQPTEKFFEGKKGENEEKNGSSNTKIPFYDNFVPYKKYQEHKNANPEKNFKSEILNLQANIKKTNHFCTDENDYNKILHKESKNFFGGKKGKLPIDNDSETSKNSFNEELINSTKKNYFSQKGIIYPDNAPENLLYTENNILPIEDKKKNFQEKFSIKGNINPDTLHNEWMYNDKKHKDKIDYAENLKKLSKILFEKFDNNKNLHEEIDLCNKLQLLLSWKVGNEKAQIIMLKLKKSCTSFELTKEKKIAYKFLIYLIINYKKIF
ncbi:hypothetical protein GVAV_002960 [Gurleya vavrai]